MIKINLFPGIIILVLAISCNHSLPHDFRQAETTINPGDMAGHIQVLASAEFEGRKPFTRGEQLSVEYLKNEFVKLGLEPAFNGSYFQEVPLVEVTVKPSETMRFRIGQTDVSFKFADDFVAFSRRVQPRTRIEGAKVVFAGYGIIAPEYGWNDYAGLDVKDKIVIVLVNDPGLEKDDNNFFTGNAMTYYGRWTYKYEEAARQGARGALIVHNTKGAGYPWSVVVSGALVPDLYLQDSSGYANRCELEGWLTTDAAIKLFKVAGIDFQEIKQKAAAVDFIPNELDAKIWFEMESKFKFDVSRNVAGLLRGTDRSDELIIFSAHWDHLGIGRVIDGDSICYGAVDNGTSIAWMLEIAKAFTKLKTRPSRSVLFLSPTAEEEGLLGAHWYVSHPVFPLSKTVANINNDLMLPLGQMRDVMITGFGQSTLDDYVLEAARIQDRYIIADPTPETGMYYRADHFAFAKVGIPALFARGNCDHRLYGREWTAQKEKDWLANNYHKPADKYDPQTWDLQGVAEDARLAFYVGWKLAAGNDFPQWKPGSEFKAIRESYMPAK